METMSNSISIILGKNGMGWTDLLLRRNECRQNSGESSFWKNAAKKTENIILLLLTR